jgi:hypothetical protein
MDRSERGEPRGAAAVLSAARSASLAEVVPLAPRRGRRQLAGVAAALLVVGAGAGAVVIATGSDAPPTSTGDPYCDALGALAVEPEDLGGDVLAYLPIEAGPNDLASLAAELEARPEVRGVRTVDRDETYERFRQLFADEPTLLDNVQPDDLPTSVEIDLVDPSGSASFADVLRARPDVWEVREPLDGVRVLDLLVWPGADEQIWASGGNVELASRAYGITWPDRADAVERHVPETVADDLEVLLDRLAGPAGPASGGDGTISPTGPTFDEAASAADALEADAADRCGLAPDERFTTPLPVESTTETTYAVESTTETTNATTGD